MGNRIEYIDSAKGLCMLLIVASHVGIQDPWLGAYAVRVILFFVLSGFFYSVKLDPAEFLKKKFRTILWPFLFFWVISYVLFYLGKAFIPNFNSLTHANGILDCFTQKEFFNGPLWFLLALFFVQIICYPIEMFIISDLFKYGIYTIIGLVGFELAVYEIDLPLDIDVAFSATPFFVMGMLLRKYNIINYFDNLYKVLFAIIIFYTVYFLDQLNIFMSVNRYGNTFPELYGTGFLLCLAYILICKLISENTNYLSKFLSYVGVNSLYIMCVHHLIYRPIKILTLKYLSDGMASFVLFTLTMIVCLVTAPFVNKWMPFILGKKKS